jgi:hypothetical protein
MLNGCKLSLLENFGEKRKQKNCKSRKICEGGFPTEKKKNRKREIHKFSFYSL